MIKIKDWQKLNDSLIKNNIPFVAHKNTFGIDFFTPFNKYKWTDEKNSLLPPFEIWYIGQVKKHVESLNLKFDVDRSKIKYIQAAKNMPYKIEDVYELDLNSAYFNCAFNNGIINELLYEKSKIVSKKTRLASLGALAKNTFVIQYTGTRFLPVKIKESKTASCFFKCCMETGELMNSLKELI